jgi:hypothetical protein
MGRPRSGGMGASATARSHPRRLERRMGTERRGVPIRPVRIGLPQPGMIGSVTADGCVASCRMVWVAVWMDESCPNGAPVLGFGANWG